MKKLVTAVMAVALVISAGSASAQAEDLDIGVFADASGTTSNLDFAGGTATFYVVVFGLDTVSINAYELSVAGLTESGFQVFGNIVLWPATAIRASLPGAGPFDFIVATGGCLPGEPVTTLVTIPVGNFGAVAADSPVCITGAGDFSTTPNGLPGFGRCDVDPAQLVEFGVAQNGSGVYPDGCLIINATDPGAVVDTETSSFGEIKARF